MKKYFSAGVILYFLFLTPFSAGAASFKYQQYFDGLWADNKNSFDSSAASNRGQTYYSFQYILEGFLGMYEGTKQVKYLEQALIWAETMISKAAIIDVNGKKNWAGDWNSPYASQPIAYQLEDLQGTVELARLARIILTDAGLKQTYGTRAQKVFDFVKSNIVDKHLYDRGSYQWFVTHGGGDSSSNYSDKSAMMNRILLELIPAGLSGSNYRTLANTLSQGFKNRLKPFNGSSLVWDRFLYDSTGSSGTQYAPDTSHANRWPLMVISGMKAGIVFSNSDITGLANLFSNVIWDGSLTSPRFTNFIDGANDMFISRPPWNNGLIYIGWVSLGAYNSKVKSLSEATLDAIIAGVSNPSLDYNKTLSGRVALAGWLTMNQALSGSSAPTPTGSVCNLLDSSKSVPSGFGASYNVLTSAKELLLQSYCNTSSVDISVGNGSQTQYIYNKGHFWSGTQWQQFTLSCSNLLGGAWCVGNANYTKSLTSTQLAATNYYVAYVCNWISSPSTSSGQPIGWKCGCHDSTCSTGYWNLQAFKK